MLARFRNYAYLCSVKFKVRCEESRDERHFFCQYRGGTFILNKKNNCTAWGMG